MQNYKLLEEGKWENLGNLGLSDNFLDKTPKVRSVKENLVSRISLALNTSALWKAQFRKWENRLQSWRKYLQSTSDKGLIFKQNIQNSQKSTTTKQITQFKVD